VRTKPSSPMDGHPPWGWRAVKYADLSQEPAATNYQFTFDRSWPSPGNTAPYLLYAVVRIAGIARQGMRHGDKAAKRN